MSTAVVQDTVPVSVQTRENVSNKVDSLQTRFPISMPIGFNEVSDIEKVADPVLRNHLITLAYSGLSTQMDCMLGHQNLNWCSFGTWASKTAGKTIREEFPPFPKWMVKVGATIPFCRRKIQYSSDAIAIGNLKVFADLAPMFATFIEMFGRDEQPNWNKLNDFTGWIREIKRSKNEPFSRLVKGFTQYYLAVFEKEAKDKAELIFYANCLLAFHEQSRLQPEISRAMKLGFRTSFFRRLWNHVATKYLLRIEFGDRRLGLGSSVRVRVGRRTFPPELKELKNPNLILFLKTFDRYMNSLEQSGAGNWALVVDRMRFISNLFRSHQRDRKLMDCPYAPYEQQEILLGNLPGSGK